MIISPKFHQKPSGAPLAFLLLAKPTGAACNLDCACCFFLDKETLYPSGKFLMSETMLEQYIRQLIESHLGNKVNFAWQSGEPTLMGLDFYRQRSLASSKRRVWQVITRRREFLHSRTPRRNLNQYLADRQSNSTRFHPGRSG